MSDPSRGPRWPALLLVAGLACAVPPRPEGTRPADRRPSPERMAATDAATPLERGLAAVSAERVGADIDFLAADELRGRDTPSPGLRVAADFIRGRLVALGFEPGGPAGWTHGWTLVERSLSPGRVAARLDLGDGPVDLELGVDHAIHPSDLRDHELAGELVWCADGEREAFAGLDLTGAIAVCAEGESSRARLRRRAEDVGAAGLVILARGADVGAGEAGAGAARFAEWTERLARPSHHWPHGPGERLPVHWLGGEAGAALLARAAELRAGEPLDAGFDVRVAASTDLEVDNVCGLWRGSDPELAREVILVSAHYDHVGERDGEIYNGADDNASGVAALLALAEALAAHGPLERSVLLLFVSGEELGLLGSRAWAEAAAFPASLPGARAVCNVNFDMVGRNAPGMLEYTPTADHEEHNDLARSAVELAALEGFDDLRSADKDYGRSDHASFARALGIPVLYVSGGEHDDYHQPTDTAEKVDDDKVARFARLALRLLAGLRRPELDLELEAAAAAAPD